MLCPEDIHSGTGTADVNLPPLSPSLLLQPFIPLVSFPAYFPRLHAFLCRLEQLLRESHIGRKELKDLTLTKQELAIRRSSLSSSDTAMTNDVNEIVGFVSGSLDGLLHAINAEGFTLLLLHLFLLFQYPETCFEVVSTCLDQLGRHMSQRAVERLFAVPVIRLFDSPIEPYQRGNILSRSTVNVLIRRFGLGTFLNRFLGFIVEAVIEPSRISPKGFGRRGRANRFRLKSESMMTLVQSESMLQSRGGRLDEHRPSSNALLSDFSYSMALSERGIGFDLDPEEFSGSDDSDDDLPPDSSLLAKSGMVLASIAEIDGSVRTYGEGEGGRGRRGAAGEDRFSGEGSHASFVQSLPKLVEETPDSLRLSLSETDGEQVVEATPKSSGRLHSNHEHLHPLLGTDGSSVSAVSMSQSMTSSVSPFEESFVDPHASSAVDNPSYTQYRSPSLKRNSEALAIGTSLSHTVSKTDAKEEEEEEEEEEEGEQALAAPQCLPVDPQAAAINSYISDMAADCLVWLCRQLGPFLSTRHIIKPVLDGLHRCFPGVHLQPGQAAMVLKVLSSTAKFYGIAVVLRLYLPQAETMVRIILCMWWGGGEEV